MVPSEQAKDGKLWIMPVILELFAFPFAWISVQMLHDRESWRAIATYAAVGIILCVAGAVWAVFRRELARLWPWHQLRVARAELAKVEEGNAQAKKCLGLDKAQHSVQCIGFKPIHTDDFEIAALCFQNVSRRGELIGKFESPNLRVIYYEAATGQEIADIAQVPWWNCEYGPGEINADESYAELASYSDGNWKASEIYRDCVYETRMVHSIDLPAADFRIIAKLSGSNQMNIPDVHGVLTLGEDGTASFQRMID